MGCLGVHFAITEDEVARLRSLDEDALLEHLTEVLEETYFEEDPELLAESDKAWDAMHRALADGESTSGSNIRGELWVINGGEQRMSGVPKR